jgi:hypothetical protein
MMSPWDAQSLIGWASGLAADFGGHGLYNFDGSTSSLLTAEDAQGLQSVYLY